VADDGVPIRAAVVVLAVGAEAPTFSQTSGLPLRVNRGQLSFLEATPASTRLTAVLCAESYAAPARAGTHSVGATFARESSTAITTADHAENLSMLRRLSPTLFDALGGSTLDPNRTSGRAALRCVSPDYLPLIGCIEPGLYVSTAHGSRGLITAPLAGEVLAAVLEEEAAPLPAELIEAIAPRRFQARPSPARALS
jgi:tRNA 5-methylaminomethyl-2-thiouridine biosynthesis bifunctional protein